MGLIETVEGDGFGSEHKSAQSNLAGSPLLPVTVTVCPSVLSAPQDSLSRSLTPLHNHRLNSIRASAIGGDAWTLETGTEHNGRE